MFPVPHAFPLHHVCVLRLSLGFAAFSGARVHAGFAGCASRSGSLDPCRLSREGSCQTLPEWGSLLSPLRSLRQPTPCSPLVRASRPRREQGGLCPSGKTRRLPEPHNSEGCGGTWPRAALLLACPTPTSTLEEIEQCALKAVAWAGGPVRHTHFEIRAIY